MPGQGALSPLEQQRCWIEDSRIHVSDAHSLMSSVENELEDGGTEWDARVKKVAALLAEAEKEMRVIEKQFNENNPPPKVERKPFTGFGNFK